MLSSWHRGVQSFAFLHWRADEYRYLNSVYLSLDVSSLCWIPFCQLLLHTYSSVRHLLLLIDGSGPCLLLTWLWLTDRKNHSAYLCWTTGCCFFFSVLSGIILPVSACHAASPCRELTVCLSGCVNVWLYLNKQYREHVFFLNAYLTYYIPYVGLVWSDVCVFPPKLYVCMSYFHEFKSYLTQQEKSEGAGGQLISPGTTGSHYWKLYFKTSAFSWCYFLFFFCDYFSDLCALWDYFPPSSLFDNMKC